MPPGPRPRDVQFNDAAAATAISELSAAGRLIRETETVRATATRTANTDFRGAYATGFAEASTNLDQEATATVEGIDALRRAIERATVEVAQERRRVAAAQAAWDADAAAERDLRRRYPNAPA